MPTIPNCACVSTPRRRIARGVATLAGAALALCTAAPALAAVQPAADRDLASAGRPPSALTGSAPRLTTRATYGPGNYPISADAIDLGYTECLPSLPGLGVAPMVTKTVKGNEGWFAFYSTVAKWDAYTATYNADGGRWKGPFWGHTSYPGWYWYDSATGWKRAQDGGGWARWDLPRNAIWRGYQWVKYMSSGRVYQGIPSQHWNSQNPYYCQT